MENDTIGQRIKKLRVDMGWSQEELATKLGYKSRSTINKIEMGINDISQSRIVDFAKLFNVQPSYLMGWDMLARLDERNTVVVYLANGKRIKYSYLDSNEIADVCEMLDVFTKGVHYE